MNKIIQWFRGFWKPPTPYIATVEAEPGKTELNLTVNGEVMARVVLTSILMHRSGSTEVTFTRFDDV